MQMLKDSERVILNGRKGYVGSVAGFAAKEWLNPVSEVAQAKKRGESLYWINQHARMLSGDPRIWKDAVLLTDGQIVFMDGVLLRVGYTGNYADMGTLTPITDMPRREDFADTLEGAGEYYRACDSYFKKGGH